MKIIWRGNAHKGTTHRKECPICETIFEFQHSELGIECLSIETPPNPTLTYFYINCPVCEQKLYIY